MKKNLFLLFLAVLLFLALPGQAENLPGPDLSKKVDSIEVYQMPDKTVFVVGEDFSAQGGILKIIYTDGSEGYIPMTDPSVTLKEPKMNTVAKKNVQVKYDSAKLTFKVEVTAGMCDVTFDLHYEGAPEAEHQAVSRGDVCAEPAAPQRDGYDFVAWYADPDFTRLYDFSRPLQADAVAYALWLPKDAKTVQVTFSYDYYGVLLNQYAYPVAVDTLIHRPIADPERVGYAFSKWVDDSGNDFDFTQPVTADTTIHAVWEKTVSGPQTWVFEAEDTVLTGKIGPSFSGSAAEEGMIIFNDAIGASGDRVVGYLYDSGITLEFWIASDEEVSDAQIALRIAGEYITMRYSGEDYQVLVNGVAKNYPEVTVEIGDQAEVAPCADRIVIEGVALKKGENLIQLKTSNNKAVAGTTFSAHAPMVDCLKVTTGAVLIWDENHGEPALNNYKK